MTNSLQSMLLTCEELILCINRKWVLISYLKSKDHLTKLHLIYYFFSQSSTQWSKSVPKDKSKLEALLLTTLKIYVIAASQNSFQKSWNTVIILHLHETDFSVSIPNFPFPLLVKQKWVPENYERIMLSHLNLLLLEKIYDSDTL